jgi:alpha-L-fucosidase 2
MNRTLLNLSRRLFLAASTSTLLPWPAFARSRETAALNSLRYLRPADRWEEALPLGNGRLGAMVFGRVAQERLQLNEDTLWSGAPYTPDNPDALAAIPEVRRLIEQGKFREAADLASAKVMAKPLQQMSYGTLGDVLLDFVDPQAPARYERSLDLETAIASTRFQTRDGAFVREAFVSAPHQVIVLRLQATRGRLNFNLKYRGPRRVKYTAANYQGSATELTADKPVEWLAVEPATTDGASRLSADGDGAVLISGRNEPARDIPSGLTFALRMKIVSDGRVTHKDGGLEVREARTAMLLLSGATSFVSYQNVSGDPVAAVRRHTDAAAAIPYATLVHEHVRDHQKLFRTVSLELPATVSTRDPTDVRIAAAETSDDPALAALYFQYSRYLLISSSRPGCQPANLQGIWNEGTNPPWGSKYTININTEMNYWPADPAGLGACVEPLLRMTEDLSATGAKTARTMYGARGWVTHHNTDLWRAAAPIDGPLWGLWPCGGAWLCNSLWDHYDYSREATVLTRLYPLMKGASLFFLDTLIEDPKGRGLITSPSLSPENEHPYGSSVCAGPAMDRQIVRDLFANTVAAARLLNVDSALAAEIERTMARVAPDVIGKGGQLQEWLEDWDAAAPDRHHRHVSHLYAVYPSSQINVRDTPAFTDAAKVSLRERGDLATGWGTAWRLCLWARLGEGDHAHGVLKALMGPKRTYPNMFDAHPPFQIDGNFGGAAGILEMLVQSWGGELRLLPALPAAWPSGEARGICARGAIRVDLAWRAGKLRWVELSGPAQASLKLRVDGELKDVRLDARGRYRFAR